MTVIDEVELIRRQIERLRARGIDLKSSSASRGGQIKAWIRDVCEMVRLYAGTGSYLNQEADKLWRAADKPASPERAQDLLNALEWRMTIDDRYAISEDFRRAVNIAIKDEYFQSWPFRVILGSATAIVALLIGGTVYSGIQVQGLLKNINDQQKQINESSTKIDGAYRELASQIEEKKLKLDEIVRAALAANNLQVAKIFEQANSDTNAYVNETKAKLNTKQTQIVQALDMELREHLQDSLRVTVNGLVQDAKQISNGWGNADKNLGNQLAVAKAALEAAKTGSVNEVMAAKAAILMTLDKQKGVALKDLSAPGKALDDEKGAAISAVKLASTTAKNDIATLKAEVEGRRNDALGSIRAATEDFDKDVEIGRRKIAEDIAKLPSDIDRLRSTMSSIDRALSPYHIDIARLIHGLISDGENKTRLATVADVLGVSFWLTIGSTTISTLVFLFTLPALRRSREKLSVNQGAAN